MLHMLSTIVSGIRTFLPRNERPGHMNGRLAHGLSEFGRLDWNQRRINSRCVRNGNSIGSFLRDPVPMYEILISQRHRAHSSDTLHWHSIRLTHVSNLRDIVRLVIYLGLVGDLFHWKRLTMLYVLITIVSGNRTFLPWNGRLDHTNGRPTH